MSCASCFFGVSGGSLASIASAGTTPIAGQTCAGLANTGTGASICQAQLVNPLPEPNNPYVYTPDVHDLTTAPVCPTA